MDDSVDLEGKEVVCVIDANRRFTTVFVKDDEGNTHKHYFRSVLLKDVEWGAGMTRGILVSAWKYQVPVRLKKRAYFNKNKCPRYQDKYTGKTLTKTKIAQTSGNSFLYED